MSLDVSGADTAVAAGTVSIDVGNEHPLIKMANALPWMLLIDLVLPDLKRTTARGFWWTGRKLRVRVHLAAYILQKLYNLTDRQTEFTIKDNAAYQLFTGRSVVPGWRPPDHTKIEEFRSRLSPETQRALANEMAKVAVALGFADPSDVDVDSTVQEANIAYPADANLMTKLAGLGRKVIDFLQRKTRSLVPVDLAVDMKAVKSKARAYFFMQKNVDIEKRREVFKDLHRLVKQQMRAVVAVCNTLNPGRVARLPWNIRRAVKHIRTKGWRYLLDVGHFTRTHSIKVGKALSFHAQAVACIRKGKVGKENEFGRVFQLGRIKGNFLFVMPSTSLRMEDKHSFVAMLAEHAALFGDGTLKSTSADKWVLEREESAGTDHAKDRERTTTACQHQRQARPAEPGGPRAPPESPGRNRAADRARQAWRTARKKSDEERCGNAGRWVLLCPRLQSTTTDQEAEGHPSKSGVKPAQGLEAGRERRCNWARSFGLRPQDSFWRVSRQKLAIEVQWSLKVAASYEAASSIRKLLSGVWYATKVTIKVK